MSQPIVSPVLYPDIIENIIDILVNDNEECLQYVKTLSLICHSFLPLCRKHIFSSIRIEISDPLKQYSGEAFERLLLETPEIAKCIRKLYISIEHPQSESLHVPRQLTRLRSLTVKHRSLNDYWIPMDWNDVSSSMQHSLLNLMRLPTLIHLDLILIKNFPISNLIPCANLKHLSADALYVTGKHETTAFPQSHKSIRLRAFDIIIGAVAPRGPIFSDGWQLLDFTGLERICAHFDEVDIAIGIREICRKSQRLGDISLTVPDICFRAMKFARAVTPSLQTLRRIHLAITIDSMSVDPLAGLCDELQNMLGNNKLESLEIQIEVQTDEDCQTGDEWGRLEKVLLKPGWPMLKRVSLAIIIYSFSREDDSPFEMALKNLLQTQFTGLTSAEKLDFQFSVKEEVI